MTIPMWPQDPPDAWRVGRLKDLVESCRNGTWGDEPPDDPTVGTPTVRVADFDWDHLQVVTEVPTRRLVEPRQLRRVGLVAGDLVLEKSGGGEKHPVGRAVRFVGKGPAVCSNFTARLRPSERAESRYLCYSLAATYWAGINQRSIKQTTGIQNLDSNSYLAEPWVYPGRETQHTIANFLDRETERIDQLMEKKRRLIELLEEKRTVLIDHAVTKGMDPTVPMKSSGIPWLGTIPAHWDAVPLRRHLASITDGPFGSSLTSSHYSLEGARVIRLGNIGQGEFLGQDKAFIPMDYYRELAGHAVEAGDVIIAGLGDERRTLGRACLVPDNLGPAIVKADCFRVRMTEAVDHAFLAEYLSSAPGAVGAWLLARGTTRQRINTQLARDLPIPVPPAREQRTIGDELAKTGLTFKVAGSKIDEQLVKLAEYRQALITAAVTGQIDVTTDASEPEEEIS